MFERFAKSGIYRHKTWLPFNTIGMGKVYLLIAQSAVETWYGGFEFIVFSSTHLQPTSLPPSPIHVVKLRDFLLIEFEAGDNLDEERVLFVAMPDGVVIRGEIFPDTGLRLHHEWVLPTNGGRHLPAGKYFQGLTYERIRFREAYFRGLRYHSHDERIHRLDHSQDRSHIARYIPILYDEFMCTFDGYHE